MNFNTLTDTQKLAITLNAPIAATGSNPKYKEIKSGTKTSALKMLDSWWDIKTAEDLESTLAWLIDEGGHTVHYHRLLDELFGLTYQQRLHRIEQVTQEDPKEAIRYRTAFQYLYDLGPATIFAFDVARYVHLVKSGCTLEWLTEQEALQRIQVQAERIVSEQLFATHHDYLLSYAVGRTFSLYHDEGMVKQTQDLLTQLVVNTDSPFNSYIDWAGIVNSAADREVTA